MRSRTRSAYTLFEVMLVLALLVVLGALSMPSLMTMYSDYKLSAAADGVRACWAQGRAEAMERGVPYRFAVIPGAGRYRLAPEGQEYWSGTLTPQPDASGYTPLILDDQLPKGVRFSSSNTLLGEAPEEILPFDADAATADSWKTVVVFLPDGTAEDDAQIIFQLPGSRPLLLTLRALTGAVTTRVLSPEELQP